MSNLTDIYSMTKSKPYGSGDSYLIKNALRIIDKSMFNKINSEIKWQEMRHQGGLVPRDISIQGTIKLQDNIQYEPIYRHPADEQPELIRWTPTVLFIKDRITNLIKQELNHALIQRYKNGRDYIGAHSDKTLDVEIGSKIVNYSLGATRTMILENKKTGCVEKIQLPHNSLFIMGWETNREWLHSIKQDRRNIQQKSPEEMSYNGQRISLTFRTISTFINRETGQLFGQGARKTNVQRNLKTDDTFNLVRAFSLENKLGQEFNWDKTYGNGFNALNFKTMNRYRN